MLVHSLARTIIEKHDGITKVTVRIAQKKKVKTIHTLAAMTGELLEWYKRNVVQQTYWH